MRRKIAKRKRRELLRRGAKISRECWIKEPWWKRKDIGYNVEFVYNGWKVMSCGDDELMAYRLALDVCDNEARVAYGNGK